jgi:serine/threonine protein kinase
MKWLREKTHSTVSRKKFDVRNFTMMFLSILPTLYSFDPSPDDNMPQMELFQCIVREKFYPLPDEVSDDCFDVVDELLEKDPTQRLGSLAGGGKDIINKKWFAFLDLDDLRQKKYMAPFIPLNKLLEEQIMDSSTITNDAETSSIKSGCN